MYNKKRLEAALNLVNDINITSEKKIGYLMVNFYQFEKAIKGFKELHLGYDGTVLQAIEFYEYISNDLRYRDYTMEELREIMIAFKTTLANYAILTLEGGSEQEAIDYREFVK